jgi:hypothetical protein
MQTQVMKWSSIASLLLAVLFWKSGANYQLALNLVCVAGAVVLIQAIHTQKYPWAAGFLAVALPPSGACLSTCRRCRFIHCGSLDRIICDGISRVMATSANVHTFNQDLESQGIQEVSCCKFIAE